MCWSHWREFCGISIHAPRGGSDVCRSFPIFGLANFNPRSPWGERPFWSICSATEGDFNPRSPWGERRRLIGLARLVILFQSTLPVGGATSSQYPGTGCSSISIHAPRGGSDPVRSLLWIWEGYFNPRSPWGERLVTNLSITPETDFNPRSPWGERHIDGVFAHAGIQFQSTLPVGGATRLC